MVLDAFIRHISALPPEKHALQSYSESAPLTKLIKRVIQRWRKLGVIVSALLNCHLRVAHFPQLVEVSQCEGRDAFQTYQEQENELEM